MVTNRVFKVIVTNGTAMTSLADATPGRYLVIKEDGSTVAATTALDREDKVQIVVNSPLGTKIFGDKVRVGDITSYTNQAYANRVEQVTTWTPDTPVAGLEYTLAIVDKSDKDILQERQNKRSYTIPAATGETVTSLVAKFITLINASSSSSVTASGTTTLVLTANPTTTADRLGEYYQQVIFDIFPSVLNPTTYPIPFPTTSGTVVLTTPAFYGQGQYAQIARLEQLSQGYRGNTNRMLFPANPVVYQSAVGGTYDVGIIEYDNKHDTNVVVEGKKSSPISQIVAVTAGNSAGIFAIFARLQGSGDQVATA